LVPLEKLNGVDLDLINNKIVNVDDDVDQEWMDVITDLYKRFGLEETSLNVDLKQYLNPKLPFTVDKVIKIGWAV